MGQTLIILSFSDRFKNCTILCWVCLEVFISTIFNKYKVMCFMLIIFNKALEWSRWENTRSLTLILWLSVFFWITHGVAPPSFQGSGPIRSLGEPWCQRPSPRATGDTSPPLMPVSRAKSEVTPDLSSKVGPQRVNLLVVLSCGPPSAFCKLTLKGVLLTQKRFLPQFIHKACESHPSSFSPLLFLVARHSIAYEYNIYFYLFCLPLCLKSLGSTQDAGAGDFLEDNIL